MFFWYTLYDYFLVFYVCFLFCVFCACILFYVLFLFLYIAVSVLFLYKFTDTATLPAGGNLIAVIKYHTISYHNIMYGALNMQKDKRCDRMQNGRLCIRVMKGKLYRFESTGLIKQYLLDKKDWLLLNQSAMAVQW
jgi:hypothetical protein